MHHRCWWSQRSPRSHRPGLQASRPPSYVVCRLPFLRLIPHLTDVDIFMPDEMEKGGMERNAPELPRMR